MYSEAMNAVSDRVLATLNAVEPRFPLFADPDTGAWETTADGNWCPGHWVGLLWSVSAHRGGAAGERCRSAAEAYTERAGWERLRGSLFAGMNYRYAGFRAADLGGDPKLSALGLRGAEHVVACFDDSAGVVPVGSFGTRGLERHAATDPATVAAVDAGYTATGLLWRAADLTGDERYRRVARRHTDTHLRWFVRDDGSVWHKVSFDPNTGSVERRYNQLTRVSDACWARGLGWSIACFADAYNATGDPEYLGTLERHVEYYRRWTPADDVPFAELGPDAPETYPDTSGAALAAYGLVRLLGDDRRVDSLREFGTEILSSLVSDYLVTEGPLRGQLHSGCYNAVDDVAPNHELVWSTYYFFVALASASGRR